MTSTSTITIAQCHQWADALIYQVRSGKMDDILPLINHLEKALQMLGQGAPQDPALMTPFIQKLEIIYALLQQEQNSGQEQFQQDALQRKGVLTYLKSNHTLKKGA